MPDYLASFISHPLKFKKPAGTSRGYLLEKPGWYISILDKGSGIKGVGECSIIPGLSIDNMDDYEQKLAEACEHITGDGPLELPLSYLEGFPSIRFGIEMALLDLKNGGKGFFYDNAFSRRKKGLPINGLVWMDGYEEMWKQAVAKIEAGFTVIKLKTGALDFEKEIRLLDKIRSHYPEIVLRLDANGAFTPEEAPGKLQELAQYTIHSIEQPIKQGQWKAMQELCGKSPIPIALDEELIGIDTRIEKIELLDTIQPQYIILKPSLLGGFEVSEEWIKLTEERGIGWWATSALESNVGLNAIAQWTAQQLFSGQNKQKILPQGLGTGGLYENNRGEEMIIREGMLYGKGNK